MTNRTLCPGGFGGKRAIVIGAGTSGLVSAAAAARHFSQVTVLDRDQLPAGASGRKGAPQSRHLHILLQAGQKTFERYVPGFTAGILRRGARQIDMAPDVAWHHSGGWIPQIASDIRIFSLSNELLEWTLRQEVCKLPNIRILDRTGVTGLVTERSRVRGVRLDNDEALPADLVIDASGRNSHAAAWLEQAGFGEVEVTEHPVDVGYSTCLLAPMGGAPQRSALLVHPQRPDRRCGALVPIEHGHWLAMLAGSRGDHPPADFDGFLDWSRGLAVPNLYHFLHAATAVGPVRQWRFATNLRRHFERLRTMPDGLVIIGDAAASINPIYAQGMTHGALGAETLDEVLGACHGVPGSSGAAGLSRRFHERYARLTDTCWLIATAEDLGSVDELNGRYSLTRLSGWYAGKLIELAWRDPVVAGRLMETWNLLRRPASLLRPWLLLRTLAHGLHPARRPGARDEPPMETLYPVD